MPAPRRFAPLLPTLLLLSGCRTPLFEPDGGVAASPADARGGDGPRAGDRFVQARYPAGGRATHLVLADLDGDRALDVAVNDIPGQQVVVLPGDGHGRLGAPRGVPVFGDGPFLSGLRSADLDRDGRLDLVALDHNSGLAESLLGQGGGTLRSAGTWATGVGIGAYALAVGDFDGDAAPDLAVVGSKDLGIARGDGRGGFGPAAARPLGVALTTIAAADLDGDGRLDLAVGDFNGPVSILRGTGDGTFRDGPTLDTAFGPQDLLVADLDGDGRPDLVLPTSQGGRTTSLAVLRGVAGGFSPAAFHPTPSYVLRITAGDLDGDGRLDIAGVDRDTGALYVLPGDGRGGLGPAEVYAVGSTPASLAAGDLDGDGRLDLVVGNDEAGAINVLLNRR